MLNQLLTRGLLLCVAGLLSSATVSAGGLLREVYLNIGGTSVADLTNSVSYPNQPDSTNIVLEFEAPTDVADFYGQRLRGFVVPPASGNYVFWIASDDNSVLGLSTDDNPANIQPIASVPGWTASRQWTKYPAQQSQAVRLESGRRYYIEALMKEGSGGDNLAVRWQLPDSTLEEPIPESRLLPWGTAFTAPIITNQPADITVVEGQPALFNVRVANLDPLWYQWQRNGIDIPGATNASYLIPITPLSENGFRFRCRLTNALGMLMSREARLTVLPDREPPAIIGAQNYGQNELTITFSEPIDAGTGSDSSNYVIDQNVQVLSARLEPDPRRITLALSALFFGNSYWLTVNNLRDRADQPNTIAPNSRHLFTAVQFAPINIGPVPGTNQPVSGGLDIQAGGTGIGRNSDQFHLSFERRTGDFDVKVRVAALDLTDVWAFAGLMARAGFETNSRFAAVLTTPSISGTYFSSRVLTNASSRTGFFPANLPYSWLRLKRAGSIFTGYAGFDGQSWRRVGLVTNDLPPTVLFGMAVGSRTTNQITRAAFRDFAEVTAETPWGRSYDIEPLGPSTRRTGLVISEIMFHPQARKDGLNLEFIELFNSHPWPEDISGYRLSGQVDYLLPQNTILPAGAFLVVAPSPSDVAAVYGLAHVLGGFTNRLSNASGVVRLNDDIGGVLLEARYSSDPPWPAAADGAGHSLVLARPSYGERNAAAWAASQFKGGSPGAIDGIAPDPLRFVRINEILAHTDDPLLDFVELYNYSQAPVDLSGAWLTDIAHAGKFRVPDGSVLPPRGFIAFDQQQLGFGLSSSGETVYLLNAGQTRVIDAVRFPATATGIAIGRFPDGAAQFQELRFPTAAEPNSTPLQREIVINEIMYHPISKESEDEFIELFNTSASQTVDLSHWRLADGVEFTFPANALIPPQGYLVIAKNAARLLTNYPNLKPGSVLGNFNGQLDNGGERIALVRPSDPAQPNRDFVIVDEVTYSDGGRWGKWSDGGSSSLELIDPRADNRLASNWADSDETAKSSWTTIEHTGLLDLGNDSFSIDTLQVLLLGRGECLIDDVEVLSPAGGNLVPNSAFETGIENWTIQGTHIYSRWEPAEGFNSNRSFYLQTSGRGDTAANQVRTPLFTPLQPGNYATLRAHVRWLRGHPEILLRLHGNYLEATGRMHVPLNLGTPGARNSQAVANAGPAIYDVTHDPPAPDPDETVRVTARVSDPDNPVVVTLRYRIEPSPTLINLSMVDSGTGGDLIANDGIYSVFLPLQGTNGMVAFHIVAVDSGVTNIAARAINTFPDNAPARECLVRWGDAKPAGNFGIYRMWFTQATLTEWSDREPSSNDPLDITFVYGNHRVVYNASALYSGSPFHWRGYNSPLLNRCNYVLIAPSDELVLGETDFVLNLPSNLGSDRTAIREQTFYWMIKKLGHPYTYRRFVQLFVNGNLRGPIFEDAQQPNAELVQEWFPNDPNGDLYKIEDWFEYDEAVSGFVNIDATLENWITSDGQKKLARYRWNWRKRAVRGSANDYRTLFALADALNEPRPDAYTGYVESLIDLAEWMRTFAFRHIVGDWDSYGYGRGKNMYAYKPEQGKWQLLDWDISFAFGLGDGVRNDLFEFRSSDFVTERMYNNPLFRRTYLRALQEAAEGPLLSTNIGPVLDVRHAALVANEIRVDPPASVKSWIDARRQYILEVLTNNAASFAITNNNGLDFIFPDKQNLITLAGTAPIRVTTFRVNGRLYPVTWASVTNWSMVVPLNPGANTLRIEGYDNHGVKVTDAADQITVSWPGAAAPPEGHVVLNEIMYNPSVPGTSYIELHNLSPTFAFDLSGWQINGADLVFPSGTSIEPSGFLLAVADREKFIEKYGPYLPVGAGFQGQLDNGGETLSLIRPGTAPGQNAIVSRVAYDDDRPWPASADGFGASLQLIDAYQDTRRVGNWSAVPLDPSSSPGWHFASVTGTATGTTLYLFLASSGDVYVDDIYLVAGTMAQSGTNLVKNGDFESSFPGPWTVSTDDPDTAISGEDKHSGTRSLHLVSSAGGNIFIPSLEQKNVAVLKGRVYTLSFWYRSSTTGGGLTVGLADTEFKKTVSIAPGAILPAPATPGETNSLAARIAIFPEIWINEIQPRNGAGAADAAGDKDPWIELYNAGSIAVSLAGSYLTDSYDSLRAWPFPAATLLNPKQYLVIWLDGEPSESTANELHANFRLSATGGAVALARAEAGQDRILDYLNYGPVPAGRSFGSFPDGDPNSRQLFYFPTPGGPNNTAAEAALVLINEWMANNRSAVADPADGDYDDWFELYNPNESSVDLSGYSVSDNLAAPGAWPFPLNTTIAAHGFLLVWADNETGQNRLGQGLHANFKLDQNGETIGLFGPDGRLIDSVTFASQRPDTTEGRFPDGASGAFFRLDSPTPAGQNLSAASLKPVLMIGSSSLGTVQLSWTSLPGKTYRLEFKDDLNQETWQTLGPDSTATNTTTTATDPNTLLRPQRYYRVLLLN